MRGGSSACPGLRGRRHCRTVGRRLGVSLALYRRYRPETFAEVIGQEHVTEPLAAGPAQRPGQPRLPVQRAAGLRQDHQRADPGPLPELRAGPDADAVRRVRVLRRRWPAAGPGRSTSSRSTRPRTAVWTTRATCGSGRSSRRRQPGSRSTSSTRRTWSPRQGFNALLKVVEEPPAHLKFIFATTEPEKVIGTIRSRTHHYPFRLVPPGTLRDYLAEVCDARGRRGRGRACCRWSYGPAPARCGTRCRCSTSCSPAAGEDGVTYADGHRAARLHRRRAAGRGGRRLRRARRRRRVRGSSTGWSRAATTRAGSSPTCWSGFATW